MFKCQNGGETPLAGPMTYAGRSGHVGSVLSPPNRSTFLLSSTQRALGMNGPRASKRAFLCELSCLPADTKVRFLGCVRQYNVTEGHLILEHNYVRGNDEANSVSVDINPVLENITSEELRVGAWLNVLGYVRDAHSPSTSFSSSQLDAQSSQSSNDGSSTKVQRTVASRPVYIDAVLVFPAGAIALGEYERILRNVQDVERRMQYMN